MRLLVLLTLSFALISCSLDVGDDFYFEKIPASNIQIPENVPVNTICELQFDYHLPNGCYNFYNIDYVVENDTIRVVTPYAKVQNNVDCTQAVEDGTFRFQFNPGLPKTYIFKFWVGTNDQGSDVFEEYELETD